MDVMHKDMRLALELAQEHGTDLPIIEACLRKYDSAARWGLGGEDVSIIGMEHVPQP